MRVRLVVISGADEGKSFPLPESGPLLIGRGRAAGAQLTDPHASRSHCEVEIKGGEKPAMVGEVLYLVFGG